MEDGDRLIDKLTRELAKCQPDAIRYDTLRYEMMSARAGSETGSASRGLRDICVKMNRDDLGEEMKTAVFDAQVDAMGEANQ